MPGPILRIKNSSGGLVLAAADSIGLNYVGKAAQGTLTQPSGSITTTSGRVAGNSTYTISSTYRPVCFVGMALNVNIRVLSVVNIGGTTWQITVYAGTTPNDSDFFETQVWVDVYCFAQPSSHTGPGLRINDDSGNLRWSISGSGGRLLYLKGMFDRAGTLGELDTTFSITSLTTPAVLGMSNSTQQNSLPNVPFFDNRLIRYGWRRESATSVRQASYFLRKYRDDGGLVDATNPQPAYAYLIDATGL